MALVIIVCSILILSLFILTFTALRKMDLDLTKTDIRKPAQIKIENQKKPKPAPVQHTPPKVEDDEEFYHDLMHYQVIKGLMQVGMRSFVRKTPTLIWVILADRESYSTSRDVNIRLYPQEHMIGYSTRIVENLNVEDIHPVSELCHRLNKKVLYGRFVLDYEKGAVNLVIFYHMMGGRFQEHVQNNYLSKLLQYKIDFQDAFHRVINDKELPFLAAYGK